MNLHRPGGDGAVNLHRPEGAAPAGVFPGGLPGYAAAVAELPLSTRRRQAAAADIVVVDARQDDWLAAARRAVERPARGLVVVDPGPLDPRAAGELVELSDRVPLVVDRPRLPRGLADALRSGLGDRPPARPRALAASAAARGDLGPVLRDLLGWLRELVPPGSRLRVHSAHRGRGTVAAQLTWNGPEGRLPALVGVHETTGTPALDLDLLGEVGARLGIHGPRPDHELVITSETGCWSPPRDAGSRERAVLQRTAAAVAGGEHLQDARELAADTALAHRVLRAAGTIDIPDASH